MMQFSIAPWRVLSEENQKIVRQYAHIREKYSDYIISLAKNAAITGEPIARHMEYEFPGEGYEKTTDMFMLGDKYLVVPMLEKGAAKRAVRLPEGIWEEDGQEYAGGNEIELEYRPDTLHVFERKS